MVYSAQPGRHRRQPEAGVDGVAENDRGMIAPIHERAGDELGPVDIPLQVLVFETMFFAQKTSRLTLPPPTDGEDTGCGKQARL
jgi:hypothetical protein